MWSEEGGPRLSSCGHFSRWHFEVRPAGREPWLGQKTKRPHFSHSCGQGDFPAGHMYRGGHQSQKETEEGGATSSQYVLPTSQTSLHWNPSWVRDAHTSTTKDLESDQMWAQKRWLVRDNPGDCPPYQRSKPPLLGTAHSEPAWVFLYRFFASNKHFMCFTVSLLNFSSRKTRTKVLLPAALSLEIRRGLQVAILVLSHQPLGFFPFYNPLLFHNFSFLVFYPSLPFTLGKLHSLESGGGDGVGGLI